MMDEHHRRIPITAILAWVAISVTIWLVTVAALLGIWSALTLALVVSSLPALSDERGGRSRQEADHLISKCISEYGQEHSNRCVAIIDSPRARASRARRDDHQDREVCAWHGCVLTRADTAYVPSRSDATPPLAFDEPFCA